VAESIRRAYSILDVKSVSDEHRVISGLASTPEVDRMGDIVEPHGATFAREVPLLLHHDSRLPVGTVRLKSTSNGIEFEASLPHITDPGTLKDRVAEAWQSIKAGLIKGVSIGFRTLDDGIELLKSGGLRFTKTEILELSLVAIPANQSASIHVVRSIDQALQTASGYGASQQVKTPGATGTVVKLAQKGANPTMKPISERKAAFVAEKAAKVAKMNELVGDDDGQTLDAQQQEEFDTLSGEISAIDKHMARLETLEQVNKSNAVPVNGSSIADASVSRSSAPRVTVQQTLPKGYGFSRAVKVKIVARLDGKSVSEVARSMYPSDDRLHKHIDHLVNLPNLVSQIRAAVPAGTTTQADWASALVDPTNLESEFIEFLRPETIIGKLNLRKVPFNVRIIEQTGGGTGYWVGQGAPKPLTSFAFDAVTLGITKVAAISVITEELARLSTPSAEELVRNGLRDAIVARIDEDLLDPSQAGTANVQPASLTNGVTPMTSAGTSADNIRTDLGRLFLAFRAANLRGPVAIIMPESLAVTASLMANALGQPEFPGLTAGGGNVAGTRVITSQYLANASGSGNMVVAIAENEVFLADDGQVTVDMSREASLQMLDNPTNNSATGTATTMVSMFQTNSLAIRAEQFIHWVKLRSTAVVFMDDVNWGAIGSPV
jgi:HK97 family phage major capsid protein/HK97 family phage prohead protease